MLPSIYFTLMAGHRYAEVKHDFENWLPKLSPRSVVLFHDVIERQDDFGVWRLWQEIARKGNSFVFHFGHGLGLWKKNRVSNEDSPFIRELLRANESQRCEITAYYALTGAALNFAKAEEKRQQDLKTGRLQVFTPRTDNIWVKRCLSLIYDLPVVDFPPPEFWRPFDAHPYDQLGRRWIAHQHLPPFESLVRWARDRGVVLITTIRHPADTLVSLYHYVRNFRERTQIDAETTNLLTNGEKGKADDDLPASDRLQAYLREKFFKTLHFSIAWLQRRLSYGIRYEDLWYKPFEAVDALTNQIFPVPREHISACLEKCRLEQMRKDAQADAAFFRGGGVGNWKTSLPASVVRMLARLPPYLRKSTGSGTVSMRIRMRAKRPNRSYLPVLRRRQVAYRLFPTRL
jgi:Sulfotransferase domain/Methyltransferase domain